MLVNHSADKVLIRHLLVDSVPKAIHPCIVDVLADILGSWWNMYRDSLMPEGVQV